MLLETITLSFLVLGLFVSGTPQPPPTANSCTDVLNQNKPDGFYTIEDRELWCEKGWTRFGARGDNWNKVNEELSRLEITILSEDDLDFIQQHQLVQTKVECDIAFYAQRDDSAPANLLKFLTPQQVADFGRAEPESELKTGPERKPERKGSRVDIVGSQKLKDSVQTIVFNNGFSNHNHYKWATQCESIVCVVFPKSTCSVVEPNVKTDVIFTELLFEPRSGKAVTTKNDWSKNRYSWAGSYYYVYFRPDLQTQVDSAHSRLDDISTKIDSMTSSLKDLSESVNFMMTTSLLKSSTRVSADCAEGDDDCDISLETKFQALKDKLQLQREDEEEEDDDVAYITAEGITVIEQMDNEGSFQERIVKLHQEGDVTVKFEMRPRDPSKIPKRIPLEERVVKKVFDNFPRLKWPEDGNYDNLEHQCPSEICGDDAAGGGEEEDELCCQHKDDRRGLTARRFCKENGFPIESNIYKGRKRNRASEQAWPYRPCLVYNPKIGQWVRDGRHSCHYESITCQLYDEKKHKERKGDGDVDVEGSNKTDDAAV